MTRCLSTLVLAASIAFAGGCSSDYEVAPGYGGGAADAPAAQPAAPASESSSSLAELPEPAPGSVPGGEAAALTREQQAGLESAARSLVPPSQRSSSSPAVPPSAPAAPASSPVPQAAAPAPATPGPAASSTPPGPQQLPIRLSAGVALPQSLPTGTAMGFSVDYQFTAGEPGTSPYLWVIEPSRGQAKRQPVQLGEQGTLQGFVLEFRPENGPFRTHIEDGNGNRLSPSLPLR